MTGRLRAFVVVVALGVTLFSPGCADRSAPVARPAATQPAASNQVAETQPASSIRRQIRNLVDKLYSPDPRVRVRAIRALGRLDYELALAETTAAAIRRAPEFSPRRSIVAAPPMVTGRMGSGPDRVYILDPATGRPISIRPRSEQARRRTGDVWTDDVVPALVGCVSDPDPRVRYAAVWALADMDNPSIAVQTAVTNARHDTDRWVRKIATETYDEMARPNRPPRRERINPYTLEERILGIIDGQGRPEDAIRLGPKALPVILKTLRKVASRPLAATGRHMAQMLKPFGPPALKGLAEQLADKDEDVSEQASRILARMGIEAVAILGQGAENKQTHVRLHALAALDTMLHMSRIGDSDSPDLVDVQRAMHKVFKPIARCLVDEEKPVRVVAANLLTYLPDLGILALAPALRDKHPAVRATALRTLRRLLVPLRLRPWDLGPVPDKPVTALALGAMLKSSIPAESRDALYALDAFAHRAAPAAKDLGEMLSHRDAEIREQVVGILVRLGPAAGPAARALARALKDKSRTVRAGALDVLGRLGNAAGPAAKDLGRMLSHDDGEVRGEVAKILGRLGSAAKPVVGALAKALKDKDATVRDKAIDALKRLGPVARAAAPALEVVTEDRDLLTALSATEALKAVRAEKENDEK